MPRITGPDIATHVARTEAAVVRAAVALFVEHGFAAVTLADIAEATGLARTSLYRYFPDKDHILLAWLRTETDDLVDRSQAIAAADAPAKVRLSEWFALQFDYAADPEHQLFVTIASTIGSLGPAVRDEVTAQHLRLYSTVETIVADALADTGATDDRDLHLVADLLLGMFRAAVHAIERGADQDQVRHEFHRSSTAVIAP